MTELILDGECRNGRAPERRGDRHWRLEARGDDGHYRAAPASTSCARR